MKKISFILLFLVVLIGFGSVLLKTDSTTQGSLPDNGGYDLRVLFVGNSFTFYNDFPELFVALAASGGKAVYQDSSTANGHTLLMHADTEDKVGARTVDMISNTSQNWDYVVLQEQSRRPNIAFEAFEFSMRAL